MERFSLVADAREPSPKRYAELLQEGQHTDPAVLAADIVRGCRGVAPGLADPAAAAAALRTRWPDDAATLTERAHRIIAGRFDLLGYADLDFGTPPDWQLDPVSGRRAPLRHWSRIPYLDPDIVGDHKVTWELNRHQYLITLAQAWLLTGERPCLDTIETHLRDWMDANRPKLGINWCSNLEVGFRAIAWIWTLGLVGDALPDELVVRCAGMLHVHGCHLEANLSTWFSPNTHLTGEALALVYLGRALPVFRRSATWHATGSQVLADERHRQVLADGVYFEQATYYHRYTTDFYLHFALLERGQRDAWPWLNDLLVQLLDYLAAIRRPDDTWPLIGDEDAGRLVWLRSRSPNDFRDTLGLGAVWLGRRDYCSAGMAPSELAWLLGPSVPDHWDVLGQGTPPAFAIFPEGGYAVARNDAGDWLLIEAGPHGGLAGGHGHADALAIELAAGGTTVLQDAGTYTYVADPEQRDRFRAGDAHSTITIGGESAAIPAGPFRWTWRSEARFERWHSGPQFDFIAARQDGFGQLDAGVVHHREILWLREWRCWIIRDRLERRSGFEAHFHTAPGIVVALRGNAALFRDATANRLRMDVISESSALRVRESWHSPAYGRRVPAQALTVEVGAGAELVTVLRTVAGGLTYARDVTGTAITLDRDGQGIEVGIVGAEWRLDGVALDLTGE